MGISRKNLKRETQDISNDVDVLYGVAVRCVDATCRVVMPSKYMSALQGRDYFFMKRFEDHFEMYFFDAPPEGMYALYEKSQLGPVDKGHKKRIKLIDADHPYKGNDFKRKKVIFEGQKTYLSIRLYSSNEFFPKVKK